MKTYSAKPSDVTRTWYIIDATGVPIGRLATRIATMLTGKAKPMFTHHIDCGDYVVVVNAAQVAATGKKLQDKIYYRHSNYPGGLKEINLADQLAKDPTAVIIHAVRGMITDNKLRPGRLERLKVYAGAEHPHDPQKPQKVSIS